MAEARAFWLAAPGRGEIRRMPLRAPGEGEVLVRALASAVSRGTEALVFQGRVPESQWTAMRCPFQEGEFPAPVKYGYASVGIVEAGPRALVGRRVFCLHPHQDRYVVPESAARPVPDGVSDARATLAANMETALNAVWDAAPGPADRIAIVGAGVVGALVARLCAALPGAQVTLVDVVAHRESLADRLGVGFALPQSAPRDCDVVFHASGSAQGLATALSLAGDEALVLELSWFGSHSVAVPLGAAFHSRRLRLVASQVGRVSPSRRSRWAARRRLDAALALLADPACDALIEPAIAWHQLPARLPDILGPVGGVLCQVIDYPAAPFPRIATDHTSDRA